MDGPIDVAGIKQLQAKLHWIKNGDRNLKYIHACANQRKKGNFISQILDENGRLCTTNVDIAVLLFNTINIYLPQQSRKILVTVSMPLNEK